MWWSQFMNVVCNISTISDFLNDRLEMVFFKRSTMSYPGDKMS